MLVLNRIFVTLFLASSNLCLLKKNTDNDTAYVDPLRFITKITPPPFFSSPPKTSRLDEKLGSEKRIEKVMRTHCSG